MAPPETRAHVQGTGLAHVGYRVARGVRRGEGCETLGACVRRFSRGRAREDHARLMCWTTFSCACVRERTGATSGTCRPTPAIPGRALGHFPCHVLSSHRRIWRRLSRGLSTPTIYCLAQRQITDFPCHRHLFTAVPALNCSSTTVLQNKALFACLQENHEECDGTSFGAVRRVCP
jgi:hypothetical protein